jgi:peptide/nickel transport system permease protein
MKKLELKIDNKNWGTSYGQLVWQQLTKNRTNLVCLWFIIVLFTTAVFAPLIANDKPFVVRMASTGSPQVEGKVYFPLFGTLTANDYSVFLAAIVGVVLLFSLRRNSRKVDPFLRPAVLWRQISICTVILFLGIILLQIFIPRKLDATDYRAMLAGGKATDAVFPLVPYGYGRTDIKVCQRPPNRNHWLGTDDVGSDVLCRLIHGTRISLSVGFVAVGISGIVGIIFGAIMGYFGGKIDFLGMRLVEIMMSVPTFFLIITIVAFFPRSLFNIMVIIGITSWTDDARFIRAEFLKLRNQDFVQAAVSLGLPLRSILFRHMLPNGMAPVLVSVTFGVAGAIFIESALSFLGFGVAPPTPSWGQMLSTGVSTTGEFLWWLSFFPGLAIFFTVTVYNLLGEGLRVAIVPKLRMAV